MMSNKIKLQPIEAACDECPFYVPTLKGKHVCAFKQLVTPVVAMASVESSDHYNEELWAVDCGGMYDRCSFLPLFFLTNSNQPVDKIEDPSDVMEDFDPFDNSEVENEETETEEEEEEQANDTTALQTTSKPIVEKHKPKVFIRRIENPYYAKVDALVCPIDVSLEIDDLLLNQLSNGNIQKQCDIIANSKRIKMGNVYITTNGSVKDKPSRVIPPYIYHAVVAGQSRLVNDSDIRKAMIQAMEIADSQGVETLAILPFDCGTFDIDQTAVVQLSTIKGFLEVNDLLSLKNIVIVMEDTESFKVFTEYHSRIFR